MSDVRELGPLWAAGYNAGYEAGKADGYTEQAQRIAEMKAKMFDAGKLMAAIGRFVGAVEAAGVLERVEPSGKVMQAYREMEEVLAEVHPAGDLDAVKEPPSQIYGRRAHRMFVDVHEVDPNNPSSAIHEAGDAVKEPHGD